MLSVFVAALAALVPITNPIGAVAAYAGLAAHLDEADRRRALDAEFSALETGGPGYPIGWKGENGTHGTVVAGPPYNRSGFQSCRDYSHTIYIDNRPQIARGAACRAADGRWQPVS